MSGKHLYKAYPLRLKDKQRQKLDAYAKENKLTKMEIISALIDTYLPDSPKK